MTKFSTYYYKNVSIVSTYLGLAPDPGTPVEATVNTHAAEFDSLDAAIEEYVRALSKSAGTLFKKSPVSFRRTDFDWGAVIFMVESDPMGLPFVAGMVFCADFDPSDHFIHPYLEAFLGANFETMVETALYEYCEV